MRLSLANLTEYSANVKESVKRASIRVSMNADNIAGVMLPILRTQELEDTGEMTECDVDCVEY